MTVSNIWSVSCFLLEVSLNLLSRKDIPFWLVFIVCKRVVPSLTRPWGSGNSLKSLRCLAPRRSNKVEYKEHERQPKPVYDCK